jgi:ABC-type branched-subunit amino acid transport system ATPase component
MKATTPAASDDRLRPAPGAPVLSAQAVSKHFGHVTALTGVSLEVAPGEVVALMGDNGAGKSTLVKILSGVMAPDRGELRVRGERVHFTDPSQARAAGIETVYQDLALADDLSAPANLFLGREHRKSGLLGRFGVLDAKRMQREAEDRSARGCPTTGRLSGCSLADSGRAWRSPVPASGHASSSLWTSRPRPSASCRPSRSRS